MTQLLPTVRKSLETYAIKMDEMRKAMFEYGDTFRNYFEEVLKSEDLELMEQIEVLLPEGYWQFEFRRQIRRLERKAKLFATEVD